MNDHRGTNAFRWRTGRRDDELSIESGIQVVDLESDVCNGANELVKPAVVLETHPFDAKGACAEARRVQSMLLKIGFAIVHQNRGNADVVVAPAEDFCYGRGFRVKSVHRMKAAGNGVRIVGHVHLRGKLDTKRCLQPNR